MSTKKKFQRMMKALALMKLQRQKKVGFGGFNFTVDDVFFRTGDEKMSYDASA